MHASSREHYVVRDLACKMKALAFFVVLTCTCCAMSKRLKLQAAPRLSEKKPKLSDFGRISHVTASALSKVLEKARRDGIPDAVSATSVGRHRREAVDKDTDFGKSYLEKNKNRKLG